MQQLPVFNFFHETARSLEELWNAIKLRVKLWSGMLAYAVLACITKVLFPKMS